MQILDARSVTSVRQFADSNAEYARTYHGGLCLCDWRPLTVLNRQRNERILLEGCEKLVAKFAGQIFGKAKNSSDLFQAKPERSKSTFPRT